MKVTSINVKPINPAKGRMVARISMTVDNAVALRGMALLQRDDGGYTLSMPLFKGRDEGERDTKPYFPITREARTAMTDAAVKAYEQALTEKDGQASYIYDFDTSDGLKVTQVTLYPTKSDTAKSKAFASVVIDEALVLNHIRLVEKSDGSRYLAMPNFPMREKGQTLVNVYHPITGDSRDDLSEAVFAEWDKREAA